MDNFCRLCATTLKDSLSLFDQENSPHLVAEKLRQFVNLPVGPFDNLPKKVCQNCAVNLDFCIQFVDRCRRVTHLMQSGQQLPFIQSQLHEHYPYLYGSVHHHAKNPQTVPFPQGSFFGPTHQISTEIYQISLE